MTRSRIAAFLLLCVVLWFVGLEDRGLTRPDEGRYAELPREMAVSGDWVTPRLNGLKYFEKPPLQYWATALAYETLGQHNWTARLWPALSGLIGLIFVFVAGQRLFGVETAIAATLMLASSLWYFAIAHINTLDMSLTCWMTLTLCGFLYGQRVDATRRERAFGTIAAWAGMALAVLSKGLIGIVLPGAVLVCYSLWQRDLKLWTRLHPVTGLAVFLLIAAPWFIVMSARNPEFAQFFFIHEHFSRFSSAEHRRPGSWWYFVPILLGGIAPWTVLFLSRLGHMKRELTASKAFHPERLLVVWIVVIFVFFSASSSKLPSYILPVFPAMALLMAPGIVHSSQRAYTWNLVAALAASAAFVGGLVTIDRFVTPEMPIGLFENMRPWLAIGTVALVMGAALALWLRRADATLRPLLVLSVAAMVAWQSIALSYEALSPATSSYHLVRKIEAAEGPFKPDLPFFSVQTYEQTLPFYLKRTMTLVDYTDEMKMGLELEPALGIPDLDDFIELWESLPAAYATMRPAEFGKLVDRGLPMRVLGRDTRRVIVGRR
ncbi:MAG: glycosyltransferase family 39 protein [Betaproteobacteria bacterium]